MNQAESLRALKELAASPAAAWIGNRLVGRSWVQICTRCGAEQALQLPAKAHGPLDVPPSFDEKLFQWKRAFQLAHEGCPEILS